MIKKEKKLARKFVLLAAVLAVLALVLAFSPLAQAVDVWGNDTNGANFSNATGLAGADIRVTIAKLIRILIGFLGIIAVGLIIYAAFVWMTAGGEPQRIEKAKRILIGAIIGLVLIL